MNPMNHSNAQSQAKEPFSVLLYYKFAKITDPQALVVKHQAKCQELKLKGRVYIAHEGLNGTVSGTDQACEEYKKFIESIPEFKGIEWKQDPTEKIAFEKMKTKFRKTLCNLGSEDGIDVEKYQGKYLEPAEWKKTLESGEDYILLDIRNKYEGDIGKFRGAIVPDLESFSQFPVLVKELEEHKDKKILMYCTGGIRCVKFSALMVKEGFKDVNQLHGGIINYFHKEGGAQFDGACFVFDDRLNVQIGENIISNCAFCKKPEFKYVNCANMHCNELFIICDECAEKHEACCSEACRNSAGKRPFDKENFRAPFRKKGLVFKDLAKTPKKNKSA